MLLLLFNPALSVPGPLVKGLKLLLLLLLVGAEEEYDVVAITLLL